MGSVYHDQPWGWCENNTYHGRPYSFAQCSFPKVLQGQKKSIAVNLW